MSRGGFERLFPTGGDTWLTMFREAAIRCRNMDPDGPQYQKMLSISAYYFANAVKAGEVVVEKDMDDGRVRINGIPIGRNSFYKS